ncbi:isochorismate synthase MenF [Balneola sp. MJW-20]|uniref:isochorismate synthase n=1 Tax=Gracilimonas aurantiaca TaxID=3234185 RepID=UPI00346590F4
MSSKNLKYQSSDGCLSDQIGVAELKKAFDHAHTKAVKGRKNYFSYTFAIPSVDPLAVLEQHKITDQFQYYFEKPIDEFSIVAAGTVERIKTTGDDRFKEASRNGKELISRVHHFTSVQHHLASIHLLGGFSFFDHNVGQDWRDFGAGSFTLPEWVLIKDGKVTLVTITIPLSDKDQFGDLRNNLFSILDRLDHLCQAKNYSLDTEKGTSTQVDIPDQNSPAYKNWKQSVETAIDLIEQDAFKKVVIARDLKVKLDRPVSDTAILHYLRRQYPDCYSFLIRQNGESSFIGSTPERLASFRNRFVLTEGLAGSISRGKTASEDAKLEYELLHSQKDLSEHFYVLDAIEHNLEDFSDAVEHPDFPGIKKLSNVQHLYTPVRAKIKNGVSRTRVLEKLHPTPAVGGYPREDAISYINKLESFERGWYAAPVGWINARGEGEFVVAIRSGLIKKEEVKFFAGCGIVKDSDPQKEWEETNLKFIPMLTALEYARK